MKKISSILISIISLVLINTLAFGTMLDRSGGAATYIINNESIATSSYVEYFFNDIGGYSNVDFLVSSSTGNITEATLYWCKPNGDVLQSSTLTENTEVTDFDANDVKFRITNGEAAPCVISGNILFR